MGKATYEIHDKLEGEKGHGSTRVRYLRHSSERMSVCYDELRKSKRRLFICGKYPGKNTAKE